MMEYQGIYGSKFYLLGSYESGSPTHLLMEVTFGDLYMTPHFFWGRLVLT